MFNYKPSKDVGWWVKSPIKQSPTNIIDSYRVYGLVGDAHFERLL